MTAFAFCRLVTGHVGKLLREARGTLLLCAIGQFNDMKVIEYCVVWVLTILGRCCEARKHVITAVTDSLRDAVIRIIRFRPQ